MFGSFTNSVQLIASNALSSLSSTITRAVPLSSAEQVSREHDHENKEQFILPKRRAGSMSGGQQQNTRSVSRFLSEFEQEQSLKGTEIEHVSSTQSTNLTQKYGSLCPASWSKQSGPVTKRANRFNNTQIHQRFDQPEAREHPDGTQKSTTMSRKPSFFAGQLQPKNTLNKPKSFKSEFFNARPGRVTHRAIDLENPAPVRNNSSNLRENNHDQPNKRPRIESSPIKGSSKFLAIPLDDSQEDVNRSPLVMSTDGSSAMDLDGLQGGLVRTPKIRVNIPSRRQDSSPSPDELLSDEDTRAARRTNQQIRGTDSQIPASSPDQKLKARLDGMLKSSPTQKSDVVTSNPRQKSDNFTKQNKSTSRMVQRLANGSDSPDALQGDVTTGYHEVQKKHPLPQGGKHKSPEMYLKSSIRNAGGKQNQKSRINDDVIKIPLSMFVCRQLISGKAMNLILNRKHQSLDIEIEKALLTRDSIFQVSTMKIMKLIISQDELETRVVVHTNHAQGDDNKFLVDFCSLEGRNTFVQEIRGLTKLTVIPNGNEWFDGFLRKKLELIEGYGELVQGHRSKDPALQHSLPSLAKPETGMKKSRLVDNLDAPKKHPTVISGVERSGLGHTPWQKEKNSISDIGVSDVRSGQQKDPITDKVLRRSDRTTRSAASTPDESNNIEPVLAAAKLNVFKTLTKWKQPLVYPHVGKKRETVQFEDLYRLEDDEFLNDNLVSLFLRYLEEQADKERMKRIHFFNSFLYETLTKDARSRREINFDAVKKWTSKVDLFSRDFIVVPVNEHLHWFVMIVCNLSYFRRKHAPKSEDEDDDDDRDPIMQSIQPADENASKTILKSDLEDSREATMRDSFAEVSLDEQDAPISSSNTTKSQNGRGRKKPRKSLQRYDIDKPVIITLDSLDQPRSLTASLLRQYIVAEAKDKRGWDIDGNEIKGMTAKGIPHQNNFSDCGLYLCMYLEQFILDPHEFVRRILQRSNEAGWPRKIESSGLRDRLRKMLLSLHNQQSGQTSDSIPPLGSILVNMGITEAEDDQTPKPVAVMSTRKRQLVQKFGDKRVEFVEDSDDAAAAEDQVLLNSVDDWKRMVNKPIAIDDDDSQIETRKSPRAKKQTQTVSPFFPKSNSKLDPSIVALEDDRHKYTDPASLAKHLQRQRSPEQQEGEQQTRGGRSDSVSTDFLTSGKGYDLDTPQVEPQQSSMLTSLSPDRRSLPLDTKWPRRSHQKFRTHGNEDMPGAYDVESVESEFQGFSDPEQPDALQQETVVDHNHGGSNGTSLMKRKISQTVAKGGKRERRVRNETDDEPQMLV